jgi:hypothetical protein
MASMSELRWDFPAGALGDGESLKGYRADASDGRAGEVSWCDYAPGESYLVVTRHPHLGGKHHVVPAGAVASVDHEQRVVRLSLTQAEIEARPPLDEPSQHVDGESLHRIERGLLEGRGGWIHEQDV